MEEPNEPGAGDITEMLHLLKDGRDGSRDALVREVYQHLRQLARFRLAKERPDHTFQATELVHEAYQKISPHLGQRDWQSREHFFAAAAQAMRQILINHARAKATSKRSHAKPLEISNILDLSAEKEPDTFLALNEVIEKLEDYDPKLAQLVNLRFFVGLDLKETAEIMGTSTRSVKRHWQFARAWLARELLKERDS